MTGRPPGAKNKPPAHSEFHEDLLKRKFDVIDELVKLYNASHADLQTELMKAMLERAIKSPDQKDETEL